MASLGHNELMQEKYGNSSTLANYMFAIFATKLWKSLEHDGRKYSDIWKIHAIVVYCFSGKFTVPFC